MQPIRILVNRFSRVTGRFQQLLSALFLMDCEYVTTNTVWIKRALNYLFYPERRAARRV